MTIQHKSLREEILFVIGRSSLPLNSGEIYERVELADEMKQVSNALFQLTAAGKLQRIEGEGRVRYELADGVAAPAPAGKNGRSRAVQKDDAENHAAGLLTVGYGVAPADARTGAAAAQSAPLPGIRPDAEPALPAPAAAADDEIGKGLDLVEDRLKDERLADAIIARLKLQLAPTLCELEAAAGMDRLNVHIHIEQVDVHLGGL